MHFAAPGIACAMHLGYPFGSQFCVRAPGVGVVVALHGPVTLWRLVSGWEEKEGRVRGTHFPGLWAEVLFWSCQPELVRLGGGRHTSNVVLALSVAGQVQHLVRNVSRCMLVQQLQTLLEPGPAVIAGEEQPERVGQLHKGVSPRHCYDGRIALTASYVRSSVRSSLCLKNPSMTVYFSTGKSTAWKGTSEDRSCPALGRYCVVPSIHSAAAEKTLFCAATREMRVATTASVRGNSMFGIYG